MPKRSSILHTWGQTTMVDCGGHVFITACPVPNESQGAIQQCFRHIAETIAGNALIPVHERLFGSESFLSFLKEARQTAYQTTGLDPGGPITCLDGAPPCGHGVAGILIHCIRQQDAFTTPTILCKEGLAIGRQWQSNRADYLILQNLGTDTDPKDAPIVQAKQVFRRIHQLVSEAGFSPQDIVRTWFYLHDILQWYADFNLVRRAAYSEFGLMPEPEQILLLPASTGIGCRNATGHAITADLLLVRTKDGIRPHRILNPAQKEAFRYGSAFSRAAAIAESDTSLIEISGTAAIDEQGKSLHAGDARSQVECTLDKMDVLLAQVGGTIRDVVSATVFVKRPEMEEIFRQVCRNRGMEDFPAVIARADICRDELLFEIDAEALVSRNRH